MAVLRGEVPKSVCYASAWRQGGSLFRERLQLDQVADQPGSDDGVGNSFGAAALKVPAQLSPQRDDTVPHRDHRNLFENAGHHSQPGGDIVPDLTVRPCAFGLGPDVVDDRGDAIDGLGGVLRLHLFETGFDASGEGNGGVFDFYSDLFGLDVGLPHELPANVLTDAVVLFVGEEGRECFHGVLLDGRALSDRLLEIFPHLRVDPVCDRGHKEERFRAIPLFSVHYTMLMRKVVIVGPPPVQVLDVTGPLEVFSNAPGYEVQLANPGPERTLRTNRGLLLGDAAPIFEVSGPIDTLIVVGGQGAESGRFDPEFIAWIRKAAEKSRRVASICTGAFILAEAGLLKGKRAVTHWSFCERLAKEYPDVTVCPDPIYLRDGAIYTSAGISAGIDLSLALVEEDHGHQTALKIARFLVMFLVRPGGQAQYSHMLSHQAGASQPLRELQVWMLEHLRENLTVEALAERVEMSARHFTRVCLRETGMNPGQFVDRMRVEAAQQMIDGSARGLKEVADAVGFRSSDAMRRAFVRVLGVTAAEYASRFRRQADGSNVLN